MKHFLKKLKVESILWQMEFHEPGKSSTFAVGFLTRIPEPVSTAYVPQ